MFGKFRGWRQLDQDVRILSHTEGFAIFLPHDLWSQLDSRVPIAFPINKDESCWIAGRGFAMVKLDVDPYASSLPLKILLGKPPII